MKTYVMVPTYNEAENIKDLVEQILKLNIKDLSVVVVDDNSPDGTAGIVKNIKNKNVSVIVRTSIKGRGIAMVDGFRKAIQDKADYIIEMDADFSHDPKYIPKLLEKMDEYDVCLGSRFVNDNEEKGGQVGRGIVRRTITNCANFYIRTMFGVKIRDCNSGFRCFKRKVLEDIGVDNMKAIGPAIVQELLYKSARKGFKIGEIPIVFVDRQRGKSKLGMKELIKGYTTVLKLRLGLFK